MEFLCTQCGACCRTAGEQGYMPSQPNGSCIYLTEENLCEIYDERPEFCNVKGTYNRKVKDGIINAEKDSERDYYKLSTMFCHQMIDHYKMDAKYKVNLKDYD